MTINILREMSSKGGDIPIGVGLTLDDAAKLVPNADKTPIHEVSKTFNRYIFKDDNNRMYMITPINIVGVYDSITIISKIIHGFSDAEHIESIVDCEMTAVKFVSRIGDVVGREVSGRTTKLDVKIPITKTIEEDKIDVYFVRNFPIKGIYEDE